MPDFHRSRPVEWEGDDRRTHRPEDCVTHGELGRRLEQGRAVMIQHFNDRFDSLESLIKSGFPNGDPVTHRAAHEGMIASADRSRKLWGAVFEKTVSGAVWGALGLVLLAVWEYIKVGVNK